MRPSPRQAVHIAFLHKDFSEKFHFSSQFVPFFIFESLLLIIIAFSPVNHAVPAHLSRIFRDNLSRIFTGSPKTLGEKYFPTVPKPVETFRPSRPGCFLV